MSSLKKIFGTNLRQLRKIRGLTLEKLAEQAGLSIETIGRIERGQTAPSFDTVEVLANVLSVQAEQLFGLNAHADPTSPRGRALHQLQATLADATDNQVELVAGIAAVVVARKAR